MLVQHSKIDYQLAKIAATLRKRPQVCDDHARVSCEVFFACWRQRTNLHEVGARARAWRTRRTQQTLSKAMAEWSAWLQRNRGVGAERTARKVLTEATRSAGDKNVSYTHTNVQAAGGKQNIKRCCLHHSGSRFVMFVS